MNLQALYEIGLHDALRGLDRDRCTYRSAARRAAWLRGWEAGRQELQDQADRAAISDKDRQRHGNNIQRLRAILGAAQQTGKIAR